jgi:hypothetical protein
VPITSEEAAAIAKRHGLSLADARALQALATDSEHAERLAVAYTAPAQLSREDLKGMSPPEVLKAKDQGRLDDLLGRNKPEVAPEAEPEPTRPREGLTSGAAPTDRNGDVAQLARVDLRHMSPDAILQAEREGRLDDLLRRR